MTLETERLILRPWKEDDAESLYKYAKKKQQRLFNIEHLYKQKRIASKGSSDYIKRMIAYKMAESRCV